MYYIYVGQVHISACSTVVLKTAEKLRVCRQRHQHFVATWERSVLGLLSGLMRPQVPNGIKQEDWCGSQNIKTDLSYKLELCPFCVRQTGFYNYWVNCFDMTCKLHINMYFLRNSVKYIESIKLPTKWAKLCYFVRVLQHQRNLCT